MIRPNQCIAPRDDMVKVNVGSAVGPGGTRGAMGAICTDQACNFLGVSAIVFPHISDLVTVESSAIRVALALGDNLYERKIQVASDCKVVLQIYIRRAQLSTEQSYMRS